MKLLEVMDSDTSWKNRNPVVIVYVTFQHSSHLSSASRDLDSFYRLTRGGQANKVIQLDRWLEDESLEVSDPNPHTVLLYQAAQGWDPEVRTASIYLPRQVHETKLSKVPILFGSCG